MVKGLQSQSLGLGSCKVGDVGSFHSLPPPPAVQSTHSRHRLLRPSLPVSHSCSHWACVGRKVKEGSVKQTWAEFMWLDGARLWGLLP